MRAGTCAFKVLVELFFVPLVHTSCINIIFFGRLQHELIYPRINLRVFRWRILCKLLFYCTYLIIVCRFSESPRRAPWVGEHVRISTTSKVWQPSILFYACSCYFFQHDGISECIFPARFFLCGVLFFAGPDDLILYQLIKFNIFYIKYTNMFRYIGS